MFWPHPYYCQNGCMACPRANADAPQNNAQNNAGGAGPIAVPGLRPRSRICPYLELDGCPYDGSSKCPYTDSGAGLSMNLYACPSPNYACGVYAGARPGVLVGPYVAPANNFRANMYAGRIFGPSGVPYTAQWCPTQDRLIERFNAHANLRMGLRDPSLNLNFRARPTTSQRDGPPDGPNGDGSNYRPSAEPAGPTAGQSTGLTAGLPTGIYSDPNVGLATGQPPSAENSTNRSARLIADQNWTIGGTAAGLAGPRMGDRGQSSSARPSVNTNSHPGVEANDGQVAGPSRYPGTAPRGNPRVGARKAQGDPCVVCNEPGNGNHYGAYTCGACASFFRRSVVEKKRFKCTGNNNKPCNIKRKYRMYCLACRFAKCFEVGMRAEGIKIPVKMPAPQQAPQQEILLEPQPAFEVEPNTLSRPYAIYPWDISEMCSYYVDYYSGQRQYYFDAQGNCYYVI